MSTNFISIERVSITDSDADYNNLIYVSGTKNLAITGLNVNKIRKIKPSKILYLS